jgi:hypothetical protein
VGPAAHTADPASPAPRPAPATAAPPGGVLLPLGPRASRPPRRPVQRRRYRKPYCSPWDRPAVPCHGAAREGARLPLQCGRRIQPVWGQERAGTLANRPVRTLCQSNRQVEGE